MPKKKLEPIIYKDSWHKQLADYLSVLIKTLVFDPLIKDENTIKKNAKTTLLEDAIIEGTITYKYDYFEGSFNAKINKELISIGAVFKRNKWIIPNSKLPFEIKQAIQINKNEMIKLRANIENRLNIIKENVTAFIKNMDVESLGLKNISEELFNKLNKEFKRTIRNKLAVQPKLDKTGLAQVKDEYLITIELPIKVDLSRDFKTGIRNSFDNFSQDTVEKLRKGLHELILDGSPRQVVRDYIKSKLKISADRCKFIARQETALLTTAFKKAQYQQYGIDKYIWRTMGDHKVRESHDRLDGKVIDWNNPPIVDEKTGRRDHAGNDFNCFIGETPVSTIGIPIRSYNRHYIGKIIVIDIGSVRIKSTPNHPILTERGWVPAQFINNTDKVFQRLSSNHVNIFTNEINNRFITIKEIHDFFTISYPTIRIDGTNVQFHNDGIVDQKVNVVSMDSSLLNETNIIFPKNISENIFTNSDPNFSLFKSFGRSCDAFNFRFNTDSRSMTGFNLISSSSFIHARPFQLFSGTLITDNNRIYFQNFSDTSPTRIELTGNEIFTIARNIRGNDFLDRKISSIINQNYPVRFKNSANNSSVDSEFFCNDMQSFIDMIGFQNIINRQIYFPCTLVPFTSASIDTISHEIYSGEVYNLETETGIYIAGDIIVSNCRCQAQPIVEW